MGFFVRVFLFLLQSRCGPLSLVVEAAVPQKKFLPVGIILYVAMDLVCLWER